MIWMAENGKFTGWRVEMAEAATATQGVAVEMAAAAIEVWAGSPMRKRKAAR